MSIGTKTWTGELTLAPAGPETPWSPGIPYREINSGLEMYCLFYNFYGLTVQYGRSKCVRYLLCLRVCQPLQHLQQDQADPENTKPQNQEQ